MSTDLAELIYDAVRAIPAGTVISYGELADRVGRPGAALAVANILGSRPDAEAWRNTPGDEIDVPWWRVMRSDGTMLGPEHEMTPLRIAWTTWARDMLISEGVAFTNDGRVASLAGSPVVGGGGARSTRTPSREASPCWKHEKVQYSCRDCAPQ